MPFKILSILILALCLSACSEKGPKRVVDGDLEPPMPNFFERNFSALGIDSDNDGVIDDVEIWINDNIKDENLRKASKQFAKDYIEGLKYVDDPIKSNEWVHKAMTSIDCMEFFSSLVYETGHKATEKRYKFKGKMFPLLNFKRRSLRNKMDEHFSGSIVSSSMKSKDYWKNCRFEVVNLDYYLELSKKRYPGAWGK